MTLLGTGVWTGNPFIAAPAASFVTYIMNLENRISPDRPLYSSPEPFKVSKMGAAVLAVFAAIGGMGALSVQERRQAFEAEQMRVKALQPYTENMVTIPASTRAAQDYFCAGGKTGLVARKMPDGQERSFNCGKAAPR